MSRFFWQCLRVIAAFAAIGILVGWLWDGEGGLMAFLALLSLWLLAHLWQIGQLIVWLERPKPSTVPSGLGVWQSIFDTLLRQAKSRKRRKQNMAQALQRLYHAFEVMPDGVLILDANGRVTWTNALAREHFLLDGSDANAILLNRVRQPEFHRFLADADTRETTLRLPAAGGLQRSVLVKRAPFDKHMQLLVSQDITRLEQLNQTRTDFIANVSHELRTPLTVINGFVETLHDYPDLPLAQREQFLALMKKDSDRMLNLLDDLLTLSRLETAHDASRFSALNLSALVGQVWQEGDTLSAGKQTVTADIADGIWVLGMQLDLHNALSNLLFNAVRYNHEGGHIKVTLAKTDDGYARFCVEDDGPGIAAEHLPRLTERFYRVDTGRSRDSGGTGLGLAITKHALAEHGSRLKIDSTVGVGSRFYADFTIIDPAS